MFLRLGLLTCKPIRGFKFFFGLNTFTELLLNRFRHTNSSQQNSQSDIYETMRYPQSNENTAIKDGNTSSSHNNGVNAPSESNNNDDSTLSNRNNGNILPHKNNKNDRIHKVKFCCCFVGLCCCIALIILIFLLVAVVAGILIWFLISSLSPKSGYSINTLYLLLQYYVHC